MPQAKGDGIVLRVADFGEWDRLLVVFAAGSGKTRMVAKGARKAQSRYASITQPFCHLNYTYYSGRGLGTLSQAQLHNGFPAIRNDLDKMAYGLYLLELTDSFLEEGQEHDGVFSLLLAALHILCETADYELLLAFFQVRFLARLGWAVSTRHLGLRKEAACAFEAIFSHDWRYLEDNRPAGNMRGITSRLDDILVGELGKQPRSLAFLQTIRKSQG
jgi:DNA repair protein RecO